MNKSELEELIVKHTKHLKEVFESERNMKAMGNSGMAQVRQKEQRSIVAKIEKLQADLDALK